MATWHYYEQITAPDGWLQINGGAPRRAPQGRAPSALSCEVALAAIRAAGPSGLSYLVIRAIVMTAGKCSADAADQQIRTYIRHHVGVQDRNRKRDWQRRAAGVTIPRIPYKDQIWAAREHIGSPYATAAS